MNGLHAVRAFAVLVMVGLLSGCAALTVSVDVYKGPLANDEHVLTEQTAVMAIGAKPLLKQLWCELLQAAVEKKPDASEKQKKKDAGATGNQEDNQTDRDPECDVDIETVRWEGKERAKRVRAVSALYEDQLDNVPGLSRYFAVAQMKQEEFETALKTLQGDREEEDKFWGEVEPLSVEKSKQVLETLSPGFKHKSAKEKEDVKKARKKLIDAVDEVMVIPPNGYRRVRDLLYSYVQLDRLLKRPAYRPGRRPVMSMYNIIPQIPPRIFAADSSLPYDGQTTTAHALLAQEGVRQQLTVVLFGNEESKRTEPYKRHLASIASSFLDTRQAVRELWIESIRFFEFMNDPPLKDKNLQWIEEWSEEIEAARPGLTLAIAPLIAALTDVQDIAVTICLRDTVPTSCYGDPRPSPGEVISILRQYLVEQSGSEVWAICPDKKSCNLKADWNRSSLAEARRALGLAIIARPKEMADLLLRSDRIFRGIPYTEFKKLPDNKGPFAPGISPPHVTGYAEFQEKTEYKQGDYQLEYYCAEDLGERMKAACRKTRRFGITEVRRRELNLQKNLQQGIAGVEEVGGVGLDKGRLPQGLDTLIEEYIEAAADAKRNAEDIKIKRGRLLDALVRFAEKVLVIANHQELLDPSENNSRNKDDRNENELKKKELNKYVVTLQAIGNAIIVQVDDLIRRQSHRSHLERRALVEIEALRRAAVQNADEALRRVREDLAARHNIATQALTNKMAEAKEAKEEDAQKLQAEVTELRGNTAAVQKAAKQKAEELKAAEKDVQKLQDEVKELEEKATAEQKAADLKAKDLKAAEKHVEQLQGETAELEGKAAAELKAEELQAAQERVQPLQAEVAELEEKAAEALKAEDLKAVELEAAQERVQKLQAEVAELEKRVEAVADAVEVTTPIIDNTLQPMILDGTLHEGAAAFAFLLGEISQRARSARRELIPSADSEKDAEAETEGEAKARAEAELRRAENALKVFGELSAPLKGIPGFQGQGNEDQRALSQLDVLDSMIAHLRYEHIRAKREGPPGRASQIQQALESAYEQRAGMAFIRPSAAFLRSSYAGTGLQDDPGLAWRNMLREHGKRAWGSNEVEGTTRVVEETDKQFWQNNRVRVDGGGKTNYVLAKDDVGNWYVKAYSTDRTAIFQSARNLALFGAGAALDLNLLERMTLEQEFEEERALFDPDKKQRLDELRAEQPRAGTPVALRGVFDKYRAQYNDMTAKAHAKLKMQLAPPSENSAAKGTQLGTRIRAAWGAHSHLKGHLEHLGDALLALSNPLGQRHDEMAALENEQGEDGQPLSADVKAQRQAAQVIDALRSVADFEGGMVSVIERDGALPSFLAAAAKATADAEGEYEAARKNREKLAKELEEKKAEFANKRAAVSSFEGGPETAAAEEIQKQKAATLVNLTKDQEQAEGELNDKIEEATGTEIERKTALDEVVKAHDTAPGATGRKSHRRRDRRRPVSRGSGRPPANRPGIRNRHHVCWRSSLELKSTESLPPWTEGMLASSISFASSTRSPALACPTCSSLSLSGTGTEIMAVFGPA